jgi:predicted lipoprotein with Yx(FWY)xxD motif
MDAAQQNSQWKAYVGNITGSLRLDDSAGNTIYQWSLGDSVVTGEIYASRSSSITWSSTNCSNATTILNEQTALGMNASAVDSIQNTFNETTHPGLLVAGRGITLNTCSATSTFVNSARQAQASADFPELLLQDTTNLIYTTIINQDNQGYLGSTTYDFQMIVADTPTAASTMYYFYAELGS